MATPPPKKPRRSKKPQGTRIEGVRADSKLTVEVRDRILTAIRAGNYMETAAAYAGVHKDTLYEWLKRGREVGSGPYYAFAIAVDRAVAEAQVANMERIDEAAKEHWQAAAWRLERRHPDLFALRGRNSLEVKSGDGKLEVKLSFDPNEPADLSLAEQ